MSRLTAIDPTTATGKAGELLHAVKAKMGMIPNMTRVMANSPAVLESYLGMSGALAGGTLSAHLRQELALATAQENGCDYCLSAHSAIGKMVGLTEEEILGSRRGAVEDAKATAAIVFSNRVLATRGSLDDADIIAVRTAGFNDGEIAEIIAHAALNIFTNYFNKAAQVEIDFPKVSSQALG